MPVTVPGIPATVVPYDAVNPHWNVTVVLWLLAFTVPLRRAAKFPMFVAGLVVTIGGAAPVVKVRSTPLLVPPELEATTLKWYKVFMANPVMMA